MENPTSKDCAEVAERLAEVIDGSAEERLYEHIAGCDACRDARHEAERALAMVREAGSDYREPADLEARLERALAPNGEAGETSESDEADESDAEATEDEAPTAEPRAAKPAKASGPTASTARWVASGLLAA